MVDIKDSKDLKKANGDVFFEVRRMPDNSFLYVNWIGIQSLETMMMGSRQLLAMLQEKSCQGLLNSNRELIGPWEVAVNWLVNKWAPQAKALGIRHYAHVLSPGIYGQRSFESLYPSLKVYFHTISFNDESTAEEWLRIKLA